MSKSLCLLIASLTMSGCASSPVQSTPPIPQLNPALAAPCPDIPYPDKSDYDAWLSWITGTVLPLYSDCKLRQKAIVNQWPK